MKERLGVNMQGVKHIDELPVCLGVAEIAKIMNVGRNTALKAIHSKGFPVIWLGRKIVIPRDKFFAWLNETAENGTMNQHLRGEYHARY